ncbi:MAG TPA: protein kinase, partial [Bacteroidota bacterium]|nr:protein kinase [Bacteroidota bacterium]
MDLIGQTISHYTILQKLGEGGMGIVYRAHDTALDRAVALKFLPERAAQASSDRERFIREARAAAGIDHPNVCTIYEVGETSDGRIFIAMALYDGETLQEKISRGPLPVDEARAIAIQAAEGLRAAHERGIVHRDVKCSNIMVTAKGQVKIMDFGLAAGLGLAHLTQSGTALGTVHCMSPEQARGEIADRRTDIWALGVVMYEMLSGRLPFRSDYPEALIYAILHETPAPLSELRSEIPADISRVAAKAMAKNTAERYQNIGEFLQDLRSTGSTAGEGSRPGPTSRPNILKSRRTAAVIAGAALVVVCIAYFFMTRTPSSPQGKFIAVLPLENVSGQADDEPLCDGMTESIITSIAGVRGLSVIDRNSAFRYKHRPTELRQVGSELGVNYVLEGSVQRLEKRLRVNAHLVNVASGFDLWAGKFDREASDIFSVQDDIASRVVSALQLTLESGTGENQRRRPTSNMDAYDIYLRGKYLAAATDSASLFKAIRLFQEAIKLDPQFALAYAALGQVYGYLYFTRGPQGDVLQDAVLATEKALALDSTLAEGYVTRGNLLWNRAAGFAHEQSVREIQKALRLNPNLAAAHASLGAIYFHIGLLDESLREMRTTLMLDPLNTFTPQRIARVYRYMGRFDSSLAIFGKL